MLMDNNIAIYENALNDIKTIISSARNTAYSVTNQVMKTVTVETFGVDYPEPEKC